MGLILADLNGLKQIMGVSFGKNALLEQALVHSSYLNENPGRVSASNERLEFLGDAVLGLVIAEKLYRDFPDLNEGKMTRWRAALVRRDTLARLADNIRLGDYLYLGKGEETGGGRQKPVNLASALEAVIAAIFLDQGLSATREFIIKLCANEIEKVVTQGAGNDFKSELQEFIQAREQQAPSYHLLTKTGLDHDQIFTVEVRSGETVLGKGSGKNKKTAETEAALSALKELTNDFTG